MFLSIACGGGSTPGGETTVGGETPVRGTSDVDVAAPSAPVDVPVGAFVTVRVAGFDASLPLMRAYGVEADLATRLRADFAATLDEGDVTALYDGAHGCDAVMFAPEGGDAEMVNACFGPSMRTVRARIGSRGVALPSGGILLGPTETDGPERWCAIEPTRDASQTRLVCGDHEAEVRATSEYLARNFVDDLPPGSFSIVLDGAAVRQRFGNDVRAGLALASAGLDSLLEQSGVRALESESARAAVVALASDVLDDVAAVVEELASIELRIALTPEDLVLDVNVHIRNASGSIVRPLIGLLAPTPPPTELIDGLPPGGFAYSAGTIDTRPFDLLFGEVRTVLLELARSGVQLARADADALERALAAALPLARYEVATVQGHEPVGATWSVGRYRFENESDARAMVEGYRALLAVLRRPAIARAVDALLAGFATTPEQALRVGMITDVRPRGFPAGSLAIRFPSFERRAQDAARGYGDAPPVAPPLPETSEIGFLRDGSVVTMYYGTSVERMRRELDVGGVDAAIRAALSTPGYAFTSAYRLGNIRLPNETHDDDAGAPTFESLVGVEAGRAVITVHVRNAGTLEDADLEYDVRVPRSVIVGAMQYAQEQDRIQGDDD